MSTRFDIIDAKQAYVDHIANHRCRIGDGCKERIALLRAYNGSPQSAAHKWGLEWDDNEKQARQFRERVPWAIG